MTRFAASPLSPMTSVFRAVPGRFFPLLAVLVAASGAGAAQPARKEAAAAPAGSPLLTPAQLRECMVQKGRLHSQTDDALKDKAAIEADKAEIGRIGTSLGEQLATLDRTSAEAVDAHNAKVEERDRLIDGYQAKVTTYNVKAEEVKATKEGYEKSCERRRYDERDLSELKRKK